MNSRRKRMPPRVGTGMVSPDSGTGSLSHVRDVFGPRPFSAHVATVGYDYDFHRGVDIGTYVAGDTIRAVMAGTIVRLHRTSFGWESAGQLEHWTESDPSGSAAFARSGATTLAVSGTRAGSLGFPGYAAKWVPTRERVVCSGSWELRMKLASVPSLAGGNAGVGLYDPTTDEHVALEYNGTTLTVRGRHKAGATANDGATVASGSQLWMRVRMDTGSLTWGVTSNVSGTSWVNVSTFNSASFTEMGVPRWVPAVYWRSTDTDAAVQSFGVDFVGWTDELTIGRFGNWLTISNGRARTLQMHFQDLSVDHGQWVEAGQPIGTAGNTGFDDRSGVISAPHVHLEYINDTDYFYDNDDPVNVLKAGLMPRTNVSNNVTVTRTTANDPDAVDSWRLRILVARADQDFDLNEVALTGNLAARRIVFDTRQGLNADNDVPKQSGVYIVPEQFTESSSTYEVSVYFNKSVVGTTFTAARVADSAGNTLWSE